MVKAVDQVEDMCKLHTYYITNAKRELPYYAIDTSECSLCEKMIDALIKINDNLQTKFYMNPLQVIGYVIDPFRKNQEKLIKEKVDWFLDELVYKMTQRTGKVIFVPTL
ncbi:hypothetical protein C1645_823384 [Glomus cerebriforme]|uniref:Uncharacterized protein n=1 Tax=Glomus cerebriforme TaxID=658196 RepID=A0A397T2S9_9GLOM|nr:hypothetical protein C1645_823384 [Glomus cerebriforme]